MVHWEKWKARLHRRGRRIYLHLLALLHLPRIVLLARFGKVQGLHVPPRSPELIISLTTIPERLPRVHLCVESLLRQSVRPDRILLWLDKAQADHALPPLLKRQIARGLTVCYRPDMGPQTKILHALREFPDAVVVSVDDDMQYHARMLEVLWRGYQAEPRVVHCHYGVNICVDEQGRRTPLRTWFKRKPLVDQGYLQLKPMGFAGVLYPPGVFHPDVFHEAVFRDICPLADDIWFKAMTVRQGVLCRRWNTLKRSNLGIPGTQHRSLSALNNRQGLVEGQIDAVFSRYDILGQLERKGCF